MGKILAWTVFSKVNIWISFLSTLVLSSQDFQFHLSNNAVANKLGNENNKVIGTKQSKLWVLLRVCQ